MNNSFLSPPADLDSTTTNDSTTLKPESFELPGGPSLVQGPSTPLSSSYLGPASVVTAAGSETGPETPDSSVREDNGEGFNFRIHKLELSRLREVKIEKRRE